MYEIDVKWGYLYDDDCVDDWYYGNCCLCLFDVL